MRFKEVNVGLSRCESILKWKVKPHRDHLRYAIVVAHMTSSIVKMQENQLRETNTSYNFLSVLLYVHEYMCYHKRSGRRELALEKSSSPCGFVV